MKKLALLLTLLIPSTLTSQSCLPDGITFTTQEQIDNFQTDYPGCTEIEGHVDVYNDSEDAITNLLGLSALTMIEGNVHIIGTDALQYLDGLNSLNYVGGDFIVDDNTAMNNFTGLESLIQISGKFGVYGNSSPNFVGLSNLETVGGDCIISGGISSLNGLNNLTSIMGNLELMSHYLINLSGFENITNIGGDLQIRGGGSLTSLVGLGNDLTEVHGSLKIINNDKLSNLSGLDNINSIKGELYISGNEILYDLTGLEGLVSVDSNVIIGVQSNQGNPSLTSFNGLNKLTTVGGDFYVSWNNSLTDISALDNLINIEGDLYISTNESLIQLTGFENINYIGGNLSILRNDSLIDITGLNNVSPYSIMDLSIYNNFNLSNCNAQSICDYLASPEGVVIIYNNANGCNSPAEIAVACDITMPCLPYGDYYFQNQNDLDNFQINYPNCYELMGNVTISGNDINNLNGLDEIISIEKSLKVHDNNELEQMSGLSNLNSIGYAFVITDNLILNSLLDLNNINLDSINYLSIGDNTSLSFCAIPGICDYLENASAEVYIWQNAPGCDTHEEVEEACETVSIGEFGKSAILKTHPNPFTTSTTIEFGSSQPGIADIKIYNRFGELLESIHKNAQTGEQTFTWDASGLPSGIYFIRIQIDNEFLTGKMMKIN